jgi:hypothetical protein
MKRLILGLVLAGLIALAVPASAPAAASYTFFVGCDQAAEPPQPSHKCLTTDHMAAYFEASEETEYVVCVYESGEVEPLDCSPEGVAEPDVLYQNELTIETPGSYELAWFDVEAEAEIGEWDLDVESPPPPPPPPSPPVLPATPPVVAPIGPPAVNASCLAAQKRVTGLKGRVKKAHGHRKAQLRAKLKKARAAVKAAC